MSLVLFSLSERFIIERETKWHAYNQPPHPTTPMATAGKSESANIFSEILFIAVVFLSHEFWLHFKSGQTYDAYAVPTIIL